MEIPRASLNIDVMDSSVIGYGTYHLLDKLDPISAIDSMGAAFQAGVNFFDTSDNYGTEWVIGKAVIEGVLPREDVVIATKTGLARSYGEAVAWGRDKHVDTSPKRIREQVEASLRILGDDVGFIDLYQLHSPDPEVTAIEHAEIMADLIDEGKILNWGVSNYDAGRINELDHARSGSGRHGWQPATSQPFYNLFSSYHGEDDIQEARFKEMGVIAHSPLFKGALTDHFVGVLDGIVSEAEPEVGENEASQNDFLNLLRGALDTLRQLQTYALDNGHSLAELSLAWLAMQEQTVVVTSPTTPEYLASCIKAANWQIPADGLKLIDSVRSDPKTHEFAPRLLTLMTQIKPYYH